jgi:HTH-type transcriptional regulator / antitoxin MqsA
MKTNKKNSTLKMPLDDLCPNCGNKMKKTTGKISFPINGEEVVVTGSSHLLCSKCKEVVLELNDSRRLREMASEKYREKYGLLAGEEIKQLRERLGLTQGQLAELLRLGVNTLSRWESGRNVQSAAMDILLRLVRDVPESRNYLKKLVA